MDYSRTVFDDNYWTERYHEQQTGWDIGKISTPLKEYIDQLTDKSMTILIPGCGNAYEAAYLLDKGFTNVTILDISWKLVSDLKSRFINKPVKIVHEDFFLHQSKYDLILEQTFFCALHPEQRKDYARKMKELLNDNGKLAGVLFNREFEDGPPFGGSIEEYKTLFSNYFSSVEINPCYNSIGPRKNTEVFILLRNPL